jgi:pimeloyl-ACP methyl ester carboxylesterase
MSVSFLQRQGLPDLAYQVQTGHRDDLPAIVFLPGYRSDMEGTKAVFLANHALKTGQTCIRFDYSGHGKSGGAFMDGTIGSWLNDALAVIDTLADGKIVLVGSSMGGWIGLLAALARPEKIEAFIGIAAAPDFTRDILKRMNEQQHLDIAIKGFFSVPSEYGEPLVITRKLLEDGEARTLLDDQINIDCPVRLLQGMKDAEVPWQWAHRISNALRTKDKKVILRENGDHRLSTDEDLTILASLVDEMSKK